MIKNIFYKSLFILILTSALMFIGILFTVQYNNIKYSHCTGDYTCLKKRTPCRYHDDISIINQWIGQATLIILVTHIYCGCFDTQLKSFIERNISSYEPYYTTVGGITCHASLAQQSKKILLIGYGDISQF